MDIISLINILKCLDENTDSCRHNSKNVLSPWQYDLLKQSALPTHNNTSINNYQIVLGKIKKLCVLEKYGDWKNLKYFLFFPKYDKKGFSVFGIDENREIVAKFEDYLQNINDNTYTPIETLIIIEKP